MLFEKKLMRGSEFRPVARDGYSRAAAEENSPRREPWVCYAKYITSPVRGGRKPGGNDRGSFAPDGADHVSFPTHGSRRGLLSDAPPALVLRKQFSRKVLINVPNPQISPRPVRPDAAAHRGAAKNGLATGVIPV